MSSINYLMVIMCYFLRISIEILFNLWIFIELNQCPLGTCHVVIFSDKFIFCSEFVLLKIFIIKLTLKLHWDEIIFFLLHLLIYWIGRLVFSMVHNLTFPPFIRWLYLILSRIIFCNCSFISNYFIIIF